MHVEVSQTFSAHASQTNYVALPFENIGNVVEDEKVYSPYMLQIKSNFFGKRRVF